MMMMKKIKVVLASVLSVGAVALAVYSCGSTGGAAAEVISFVNSTCSPDTSCLTLTAPNTVAVGDTDSFRARLVDGSGVPVSGVDVCFEVEDNAATIVEPVDGCGLTDANGNVSGQLQPVITGSYQLIARAVGLTVRKSMKFTSGTPPAPPGSVGSNCVDDADCNSALFCSFGSQICPQYGSGICNEKRTSGSSADSCCTADSQCISGDCNDQVSRCRAEPTPSP
jgi:hypothetical protein